MEKPSNALQIIDQFIRKRKHMQLRIDGSTDLVLDTHIARWIGKVLVEGHGKWKSHYGEKHCAVCGIELGQQDYQHHHPGQFHRMCKDHVDMANCYDLRYELQRRGMPEPVAKPDFWEA